MKKNKGMSLGEIATIGAGAVALGASAYYFLGPKKAQHQKGVNKWVIDAKKKIVAEIKKEKEMTSSVYAKIVDGIIKPYIGNGATASEAAEVAKALKQDWKHITKLPSWQLKKKRLNLASISELDKF